MSATGLVLPPMVSAYTFGISDLAVEGILEGGPSSATWGDGANKAVYVPILIPAVCVVRRVWWANGSTVSASYSLDVGVYNDAGYRPGSRLVSCGGTAQGTATNVQFADVTDTTLAPGRYWLAMVSSSTSATVLRWAVNDAHRTAAAQDEESAYPLPATATPTARDFGSIPLFGFATTASP